MTRDQPNRAGDVAIERVGRLPNLVLAGVTKAGTTSLVRYLGQHPEICTVKGKGPDYFTPLRYGSAALGPIETYTAHFAGCDGTYVLDGSVTYCSGGQRMVQALRATLPEARVIISLRNPVDRLWSSYKMKRTRHTLPDGIRTFADYVAECERLHSDGSDLLEQNASYRSLSLGLYADYLPMWWDAFDSALRVLFFDDLATTPQTTLEGVFDWLGLDSSRAAAIDYTARNRTMSHRSVGLRKLANATFKAGFGYFDRHPAVVTRLGRLYRRVNAHDFDEAFDPDLRRHLAAFYDGSNRRLAEQLTARGHTSLPEWLQGGSA